MMKKMSKIKILVWIVIILIAINLATIISGIVYSSKSKRVEAGITDVPFSKRSEYFHQQLGLTREQRDHFTELNREFNRDGRLITNRMNSLRLEMVREMAKTDPDRERLDQICDDIGALHTRLKGATVEYYLEMKDVCDSDQQDRLNVLFEIMLDSEGNMERIREGYLRQGRMMRGRGRSNENTPMFN
jgi:Spy/CpxP family protein refolding chaperone